MDELESKKILIISSNKKKYHALMRHLHQRFPCSYLPLHLNSPDFHRPIFAKAMLAIFEIPNVTAVWERQLPQLLKYRKLTVLLLIGNCKLGQASRLLQGKSNLILDDSISEEKFIVLMTNLLHNRSSYNFKHPTRLTSGNLAMVELLGDSRYMCDLRKKIACIGATNHCLLISGETGTGKTHLSSIIHRIHRPDKPYIKISCGAITDTLCSSEFFGSVRGAFTGAENRSGLFEAADGGVLLIDEIHDLGRAGQAALLRFFDNGEFTRVGSSLEQRINTRIICTVQQHNRCSNGIRSDLWFRMAQLRIHLLPLQQHASDIPILAQHFLKELNPKMQWSRAAMALLAAQRWPGNIRQLRSLTAAICTFNPKAELISAAMVEAAFSNGQADCQALITSTKQAKHTQSLQQQRTLAINGCQVY